MYNRSECEDVIEKTSKILNENRDEWLNRYSDYGTQILKNLEIIKDKKTKFNEWAPLYLYMNVAKAKGNMYFSLRFQGQDVAELKVRNGEVIISTKGFGETNKRDFNYNTIMDITPWNSDQAKDFRSHFSNVDLKRTGLSGKGNDEHRLESLLLTEFSKKTGNSKALTGIQPVKLAGVARFQMPTPLTASNVARIKYSGASGGGIDILCRAGKGGGTRLCIMEVKDTNDSKEPPEKVIKQGLVYATFIRELLRSNCGQDWWNIFGFSGLISDRLVLYVASVMPAGQNDTTDFAREEFPIGQDCIILYYMYIQENDNAIMGIDTSLNSRTKK